MVGELSFERTIQSITNEFATASQGRYPHSYSGWKSMVGTLCPQTTPGGTNVAIKLRKSRGCATSLKHKRYRCHRPASLLGRFSLMTRHCGAMTFSWSPNDRSIQIELLP